MKYSEIVEQVSKELELPIELVNKTYRAYWLFVKHIVQSQPIESIDTEEEFVKLRPNINIPSLGKLYISTERFCNMKKRFKFIKELKEKKNNHDNKEDKATV